MKGREIKGRKKELTSEWKTLSSVGLEAAKEGQVSFGRSVVSGGRQVSLGRSVVSGGRQRSVGDEELVVSDCREEESMGEFVVVEIGVRESGEELMVVGVSE